MECTECGKDMNMESPLKEVINALIEAAENHPEIMIEFLGDTCRTFQVGVYMKTQVCPSIYES